MALLIVMLAASIPARSHADQIVRLHRPSVAERKIITEIFNQDDYYSQCLNDPHYVDHFTWKQMNVAEVDLDSASEPEIVTMIDGSGDLGNSGDQIDIWKKRDRKWIRILGDNLLETKHFYITDRKVNGFSVLRFPHDPHERIVHTYGYTCPDCPD